MTFDGWNDELYHHGIKGQKWGVRRWQNSDGSLTEAGQAHYNLTGKAGRMDAFNTKILLNSIQRQRAKERAKIYEKRGSADRISKKLEAKGKSEKLSERKKEKLQTKIIKNIAAAEKHSGREREWASLEKSAKKYAENMNYTVSSRPYARKVQTGKQFAKLALSSIVAGATAATLGFGYASSNHYTIRGKKYKVRT